MIWYTSISSDGKKIVYEPLKRDNFIKLRHLDNIQPKYLEIKNSLKYICFLKFIEKDSFLVGYSNGIVEKYSSKGDSSSKKEEFNMNDFKIYRNFKQSNSKLVGNDNELKIILDKEEIMLSNSSSSKLINAFLTEDSRIIVCNAKDICFFNLTNLIEKKVKYHTKGINKILKVIG